MKLIERLLMLGALSCAVVLTGCASSANKDAMVPQGVTLAKKHEHSVAVRTSGGAETTAMDSSNIADPDFRAAIEAAIVENKAFRSVVQGKDADYDLAVSITQLDKPVIGFSFTVNLEASWVLSRQSDKSVVLKKMVRSSHTATVGDAFAGVTRLRMAVEGAARKNIELGLQEIGQLSL